MATILTNTYTILYGCINKEFAKTICQVLQIQSQRLTKPKKIPRFDNTNAKPISHAIYPTQTICTHGQNLTLLVITKLENHLIILGQP